MKDLNYKDPYHKSSVVRGNGQQTNNGIIKVMPNYERLGSGHDIKGKLKYLTITNHNGLKVHISSTQIPELIDILLLYR